MKLSRLFTASLLALPLTLCMNVAQAASVTGVANIAGTVTVTNTDILFSPTFTNATNGSMETGSFAGLTGGTIKSLTGGPVTGNVNVPGFINFNQGVATPITFDLTYLAPGVGTVSGCASDAVGSNCTPANSPFSLYQLGSNTVVASLVLNGNAYTGTMATGYSLTTGVFSTQFVMPGTITGVLAQLSNGGVQGTTYSASFVASPVPEPASILLMGAGLVGAGVIARRKRSA